MIRKLLESPSEFLELTLRGKRVTVTRGELGADSEVEEHELATVEEAQFFVADAAREVERRGWVERAYEESYDDGPREPALEAAITHAPEEPGGYLVYADWLQQRGEPRGELIVLQHALATGGRDAELRQREAALLDEHPDRLRGPLALAGGARVDWWCGFVRALDLSYLLASGLGRTLLAPLFAHASLRFLHRFAGSVGNDTDLAPLAERAPPTLRWLELDGDADRLRGFRRRLARLPPRLLGVEHLQVQGRTYRSVAEWLADGP
ncbi:MAG: TIGR02996 domain-containing protein [Deltaproteobacteria bacterium]|nr:TIGR02996 domain-containing protein [Deltaproteobacteria bacterium]